jgi:hypothetical protein
MLISKKLANDP